MTRSVLFVSPEPPYPLNGGGAFRIASLIHYFARFADVDLILFSDSGKPAVAPPGLLRSQTVIPLAIHRRDIPSRYLRNARRAMQGVPPLVDRLSGHADELAWALAGKHYDLGIVEHFWCAPYLEQVTAVCERTVLDLHNVESILHDRCAGTGRGLVSAGERRFARCSRKLESALLPCYSAVLTTSETDAAAVREIAPASRVTVYPNAIPETSVPLGSEEPVVVFSGNFEYHPNIDAVRVLVSSIWPDVMKRCPELRLRLVGRGDKFIRGLLPSGMDIETTGPIEDALKEIAAARIVIAPLRAGSGTRIKILEAWAVSRPVIATSIAAEGLEYQAGKEVIISDKFSEFSSEIIRLNKDALCRATVGAAGRQLYVDRYTWLAAWRSLDAQPLLAESTVGGRYTEG